MDMVPDLPRKRVHFSLEDTASGDGAPAQKRPRFPKGKKDHAGMSAGRRVFQVEGEEDDSVVHANPRAAAKERAMKRILMAEELRNAEDDADDLAAAEEDYQTGEVLEDDGVKIEPFNLKQEREEGFFDAEGNYVEYRVDNGLKDAWLDSVEVNTRVRPSAAQLADQGQAGSSQDLSLQELRAIKRRIADVLQPGETVLNALRRLKASARDGQRRMPEATKLVFDKLTEDAMRLLDDGDIDVYSQTRETFLAGAGYLAAPADVAVGGSMDMFGGGAKVEEDMFSDDVGQTEASTSTGPSTETDIFAAEPSTDGGQNSLGEKAELPAENSGYILDESTGYYYNGEVGYYYDPTSGLFCNAASGIWFAFDEATNSYLEVSTGQPLETAQ